MLELFKIELDKALGNIQKGAILHRFLRIDVDSNRSFAFLMFMTIILAFHFTILAKCVLFTNATLKIEHYMIPTGISIVTFWKMWYKLNIPIYFVNHMAFLSFFLPSFYDWAEKFLPSGFWLVSFSFLSLISVCGPRTLIYLFTYLLF